MPEPLDDKTAAFMATFHRYAPKMKGVAVRLGVPPADAEELIQGIFMVYLMEMHEVENVPAYLLGCIRLASLRHLFPPDAEAPCC